MGRSRRRGLRPRGRVQPRPRRDAQAHLRQGHRLPRRAPHRAHRPHPGRRHRRLPPLPHRRRPRRPGRRRPRHAPRRTLRRIAGIGGTRSGTGDALPDRPGAGPLHPDDRPRGRHRRRQDAPGTRHRSRREPHRPRRHRQEPARDRDGSGVRRHVPRRGVLRAPRGRARARTAAADDRLLSRHPRQRRSRARGAHRPCPRRSPGAHRARQLRADRGCRARARAAVHGRADGDVPGDEPHRAAHPRRARVRGGAAVDACRRWTGEPGPCDALGRGDALRRSRTGDRRRLRRQCRERRRPGRHLPPARGAAARHRARGGEGAHPEPRRHRGASGAQPAAADGGRARPSRTASHDARDDRLEREPAPRLAARTARGPRRVRHAVHARGGRGARRGTPVGRTRHRRPDRAHRRLAGQAERGRRAARVLAALAGARVRARTPEGAGRRGAGAPRARRLLPRPRAAHRAGPGRQRAGGRRGALGLELPNLRAAVRHLVHTNRLDDAGDFAWSLLIYWWISGLLRRGAAVDAGAPREAARPAHHAAHPRDRMVLRALGRDVAAPERAGGRRARRVRAAVHRERRRGCRGDGARRACDGARAVLHPRHRPGGGGAA